MFRRADHSPDLGNEPPLDATGSNVEIIDRRDVSLRWLGASILVGIAGGALIGASIYIAFQGFTSLVETPRKARSIAGSAQNDRGNSSSAIRKGDRLLRQNGAATDNKGGMRLPTTIKVGNREIIKVRQFIRVSTSLLSTTGLYASNIPAFNPLKLMSGGEETAQLAEPMPEVTDADVSLTKTDLNQFNFSNDQQILSDNDALTQLEAERALLLQRGQNNGLPISPQFLPSRPLPNIGKLSNLTNQGIKTDEVFSGIEVRVIPENVTNIAKDNTAKPETGDTEYTLKKGETLQDFLTSKGATPDEVTRIVATLEKSTKISALGEGQKIRLLIAASLYPGQRPQILRISLVNNKATTAIAALSDKGGYVSVLPDNNTEPGSGAKTQIAQKQPVKTDDEDDEDSNESLGTARIYESLYETAAKNNMPVSTVEEMIRLFGSDIDFQRRVSSTDSIDVLYSVDEDASDKPEMLYAAFTVGGETRKLYRYQNDDGNVDYLDEQGRSLKRFLLRKPITDGIMRSGFGMRRHPVLGYAKMHSGVDWSNKIGTPILAAGNGTIITAGWKSGYGQRIEIQHANGYMTSYSHQSRFASGSVVGARVRQGQVIGYVGNTGLATGPHLHYEVEVNGHVVDPMRIRVPRGKELDGNSLADFQRQRKQVDSILEKTNSSVAVARNSSD